MNVVITAGPTQEPIDPVRYISNRSTGQMGYAIAREAKRRGHKVTLISGPVALKCPIGIKVVRILTTKDLLYAVKRSFKTCDCLIMAAAVADFRPKKKSSSKITASRRVKKLELVSNPDILEWCGRNKGKRKLIGFCLETGNLARRARSKLKKKNLDLVVANQAGRRIDPFGKGKTRVLILAKNGFTQRIHGTKEKIARALLGLISTP